MVGVSMLSAEAGGPAAGSEHTALVLLAASAPWAGWPWKTHLTSLGLVPSSAKWR